jgi:DNA-binding transcriptional ArsR family regulator
MAYCREVDSALKALAEPRRREILRLVWSSELPAADIAAHFTEVTRSAISQHLGVLREAQLVTERRDGTRRLYQADQNEMARLRQFLGRYWTDGLHRLRDAAEAAEAAERDAGPDRRDSDRRDKEH